jgi:hypothetical protein
MAFVGFQDASPLGTFDYLYTNPEAGTLATVDLWNELPFSLAYLVAAADLPPGTPSQGVHFVFQYTAATPGQVMLGLWDDNLNFVDAVSITVMSEEFGACCDWLTGNCYMSEEGDCPYAWLGAGSDCTMCQHWGFCCEPDGSCYPASPGGCPGEWVTDCGMCGGGPQESGACCDQMTGNCYISYPWDCPYTWLGPYTDCSMCAPPEQGACCNTQTGECYISDEGSCPFTWLGAGTDCSLCAFGACCDKCTGTCYISQKWACPLTWLGPGTNCSSCKAPPKIKVEIHTVKGSGITEGQIREWINKANQIDCPDAMFVVDSNHVYPPDTPYDPTKNNEEKCRVNIWGVKKNPGSLPDVSYQEEKVISLVPGDGTNIRIKDSTLSHELNHYLGLTHKKQNGIDDLDDPENKMYPDNRWVAGVLKSCHRTGTKLEEWQRKKIKEKAEERVKASDAVTGGYGDEIYDNIGDVGFEYIDLDWMQGWIEWIQNVYLLHLTAQVGMLSFENYSEVGFYIESDNCQSTGQPPEGLDYYLAFQPENEQIIFMIYDTDWTPLDPEGISFEFTYINPDVNLPPIPSGVKFGLPLPLLQRRAGDVISFRAAAQNGIQTDVSPNAGLLSIKLHPEPILGDLNLDGKVDYDDLKIMTEIWLKIGCSVADIYPVPDGDSIVDFKDLADLANNWLEGTTP